MTEIIKPIFSQEQINKFVKMDLDETIKFCEKNNLTLENLENNYHLHTEIEHDKDNDKYYLVKTFTRRSNK